MEDSPGRPRDILDEMAALAGNVMTNSDSESAKAACGVVPSPRGIQDILFDFPTSSGPSSDQISGPSPIALPHYNPASICASRQNGPLTLSGTAKNELQLNRTQAAGFSFGVPPPLLVVPPSTFSQDLITPWLDECPPQSEAVAPKSVDAIGQHKSQPNNSLLVVGTGWKHAPGAQASLKRARAMAFGSGPSKVMPPTAKSILERRERAIREGRRHEARLNSEERRILRRLRNRESAERCAKRKLEEADQLAEKIAELERENLRLRSIAVQYENAVVKLEEYLGPRALMRADENRISRRSSP